MAPTIIPYGKLANGNYGILIDNTNGKSLASVMEVVQTLPALASPDNFDGRLVFVVTEATAYVYAGSPNPKWVALEGVPADVGPVNGVPPTVPTPQTGGLFYDTDTQVMFVWDGAAWKPIGGLYAAQILQQKYTGDGTTVNFPTGANVSIPSQYVEVFLDGVRQTPNPGGDFSIVGTNVSFNVAVPNGVIILIRSTVSQGLVQNAQVTSATYTAVNGQTQFSTGIAGADPAGVLVVVNGLLKALSLDYQLIQQDTKITAISKISSTVARATTNVAHNLTIGNPVIIGGTNTAYYNSSFTVLATPSTTQFDFTVPSLAPASASGNPTMYYSPAQTNDRVQFAVPMVGGEKVDIRSFKNVVVAPSVGEANTLGSIGTGQSIVGPKVGTVLQLKSIQAGPNVNVSSTANEVVIGVTSGDSFTDRVGINSNFYLVNGPESYIGVRNTSFPVTIDLSGILIAAQNSGRKITVQDESGGASVNGITIQSGSSVINGAGSYIINSNYGSVTMVFDGSNWFIIARN